jgi:hypothetical protein
VCVVTLTPTVCRTRTPDSNKGASHAIKENPCTHLDLQVMQFMRSIGSPLRLKQTRPFNGVSTPLNHFNLAAARLAEPLDHE